MPLTAVVLMSVPAADAVPVSDEQIIGDPGAVDDTAPYGLGFQYQVTLRGVDPPAIWSVVLATGSALVGGRVVAIEQIGGNVLLTLEIIPISEMFDRFAFNETLDLNNAPFTIPETVTEFYDVTNNPDGSFVFNLKPDVVAAQKPGEIPIGAKGAAVGTRAPSLPSFNCKFSGDPFLSLNLPPTITLEKDLSLPIIYDEDSGELRKLSLKGTLKGSYKLTNTVTAQIAGKGTCKLELILIRVPMGGPIGLIFSGLIPIGVGVEVGGKVALAGFGFTIDAKFELST